jgi:hypothetical protein
MTYLVFMKMHAADGAGVSVQGVHAGSALRVPHFQGPTQGTGTATGTQYYSVMAGSSVSDQDSLNPDPDAGCC